MSKPLFMAGALGWAATLWATSAEPTAPKEEALVIVVHKSNPLDNLSSEELRRLFIGERSHWANGRKVTITLRASGQPDRDTALQQITGLTDAEFKRHWLQITFTGEALSTPKELNAAVGLKKFIFNVPGAIGCVRASELDDTLKVVRVDGRVPGERDYKFKYPVP
jgi:phosphate transport system substrate-binding protein